MSLHEIFRSLPTPSVKDAYTVEVRADRAYRVGRSFEGHPAVLIDFTGISGASTPRRLAHLVYKPPMEVQITSVKGASSKRRLAILECKTTEDSLCQYFFRIVSTVLLDERLLANETVFEEALDTVVTLFRALQRPGARTVQGFWAELAMIVWARNPGMALASWHSSPRAVHDFAAGPHRLEVKSSLRGLREHEVRLEQMSDSSAGRTFIASVLLTENDEGLTVEDLVKNLREALRDSPEKLRRLETITADSLGMHWRESRSLRFSLESARGSLRLYPIEAVPKIPQPIPPEIKQIRYTVDLSTTVSVEIDAARNLAQFFDDLLPETTG